MTKHNYMLELDVIEAAGVEAIQRLAEKGNTVYVPFEDMERRAALKEKDRYSQQFAATLDFITENGKKSSRLLNEEDPTLYDWLVVEIPCTDVTLQPIINILLRFINEILLEYLF